MNKIITDDYNNKLNALIASCKRPPHFQLFLDGLKDEIQKDQNRKASKAQKIFSLSILDKIIEIDSSDESNRIFNYLNLIIEAFDGQYLHIHINVDLDDNEIENLISMFAWEALSGGLYDRNLLDDEINKLKSQTEKVLRLPSDNNGHLINKLYKKRYGLKRRMKFIESLKKSSQQSSSTGALLNINKSYTDSVNLSEFYSFPEPINAYVNFGDNLRNTMLHLGREKAESLSIVFNLFPSITGKGIWYKDFIRDQIKGYKNFKKVITITSGEKTPENLLKLKRQNKFQSEETYFIFSFELA